jgi:glycosyltransferase involved in cell wall biosynthesis
MNGMQSTPAPAMTADRSSKSGYCVIMPAYREQGRIGAVVRRILTHVPAVLVVDDGSQDRTAAEAREAGAEVVQHERNQGKGVALMTGFKWARERRFEAVITMDADGQHNPDDIPRFIEAYERTGIPVLIGNRMADLTGMPWDRRATNKAMSWLLSREMKQYVPDTQCGFRLYRADVIPLVTTESARFAAESEILLHVADRGIRIDAVPVTTIYKDEKSKINPFKDTLRFFRMLHHYHAGRKPKRIVGV